VRSVFRSDLSGVGVAAHPMQVEDHDDLVETRNAMLSHVPDDEDAVLAWCLMQPTGTLLALLAVLVSAALDLTHEKGAPSDRRRQGVAEALSEALDLDMRQFWQADLDYWSRLPKAELLKALADAPDIVELSASARDATIAAHARLKREELAARVSKAWSGEPYLPELLVTPVASGAIEMAGAAPGIVAK
jgi:hypothetical protein